ncbi:hypothetical protein GW7_19654 [Heterocephalus glaber]|uniref:Uncharacterized protein n=1 Tax=Heterocephalus glaber TaxID=10181 RepID=G5C198_HETGA|nr:hypothetical protein GW7_19654 [Heterocephalus glaber]
MEWKLQSDPVKAAASRKSQGPHHQRPHQSSPIVIAVDLHGHMGATGGLEVRSDPLALRLWMITQHDSIELP